MLCHAATLRTSAIRPHNCRQRSSKVVRAAWNPVWEQPQSEQPERFRSLFAAPYIPASENPLTVYDARDALEACSGLWGEERQECLSVFGVDAKQADTFYSTVLILENAYAQDTDPEEEASHDGQERC